MFDTSYPRFSDEWWLRILRARLNERPQVPKANLRDSRRSMLGRRDWMDVLWSYRAGEPPMTSAAAARIYEADPTMKPILQEFIRLGRANYAGLSVQALLDLITLTGVRTDGDADGDGDDTFRRVLDNSGSWLADALDFSFTMSEGFVMVSQVDGRAVITAEDPRNCVVAPDPVDPNSPRAALKVYTDDLDGSERAHLFIGARGSERVRVARREQRGGWEWDEERSGDLPFQGLGLPLVPLNNKLSMGEFEPALDVLDRINDQVVNRLWITRLQAFRQRALVPDRDAHPMPNVDPATGEKVNLDELFVAGPNALWKMPPGWKLWESQPLDITPILAATKDDVREFSAVTGTPLGIVASDNVQQSGQGARNVRSALTDKARDRIIRVTPSVKRVARLALAAEGKVDLAKSVGLQTMWAPIDQESLLERGQAASSAKASGIPEEIIASEIWKFDPDTLARLSQATVAQALRDAIRTTAESDANPG